MDGTVDAGKGAGNVRTGMPGNGAHASVATHDLAGSLVKPPMAFSAARSKGVTDV
jgi:hypothetical protein